MSDGPHGASSASSRIERLETPSIWLLALLPVVAILTLLQGLPLPAAGTDPFGEGQALRQVIMTGVWVAGLILAYFDSRYLKSAGFTRPFGWLWALIGGGVYIVGRCVVVNQRNGGALRPMWAWIALAVFYVVFAVAAAIE
jgi:hypothetical protein